ncbi:MAG: C-terminal target protein [Chitinophagaceae bacterium]|nr:C-terminal target protein [Chitinophagaceae bacterium]
MTHMNSLLCSLLLFLFTLSAQATTRTVTSVLDNGTAGTLRTVLSASANGDIIQFNITGASPHVISLASVIAITQSNLTLDATTQSDYTCGNPTVVIDLASPYPSTFTVQGTGNIIKGISFRNLLFAFNGGGSHQVLGCWFNLNDTGAAISGNNIGASLMTFTNSTGNTIGGTACGTRNVFSMGGATYTYQGAIRVNSGCNNTIFRGNYFGTDKTAMTLLNQNSDHILWITNSTGVTIDQNVICGAQPVGAIGGFGIYTDGASANGLTITNNKIGVRSDGTDGGATWGNAYGGAAVESTTCNSFTFNNNIVCRNGLVAGADIQKCGLYLKSSCATVNIKNNFVGITPTYQLAGNYFTGIFVNGTCSNVTIDNNYIGNNGYTLGNGDESHGLSLEQSCTNVSITNNYIGTNAASADLGNGCSGITISGGSNYTITGNIVSFNKGKRSTIPNAGIVFTATTDVVVQGNTLGGGLIAGVGPAGQNNQGNNLDGGAGLFISGASARFRIGGMSAGQQNKISYNRGNGIEVQNGDYIEMRWNSLFCNGAKAIDLNYGTAAAANNNFGNGTVSITTPASVPPSGLSGTRPANSIMDVFGTGSCASSSSCIVQSEYRYTNTYVPATSGVAGTTWSYVNGSTMYNDLSAQATGSGGDCNLTYCRTSEFAPCIDNVLPVTLVRFDVTREGETAVLNWQTAQEKNASHFVIERSSDGQHFTPIGSVSATGTETSGQQYHYTDEEAMKGTSYYRLREEDLDGQLSYSEIRVLFVEEPVSFYTSPNPNNGNFNVHLSGLAAAVTLQVHDLLGNLVYTQRLILTSQQATIPVTLSGQHIGMYVVSVTDGQTRHVSKVTVE